MKAFPRRLVITIDGPAGAGKSTGARGLAAKLGYRYVDTGAMYRAAGWAMLRARAPDRAVVRVVKSLRLDFSGGRIRINGVDATKEIRSPEVAKAASRYAADPFVRRLLVARQRAMGRGGGVVMEGRDIGTIVFPRAKIKFFVDASPEERARRRWQEFKGKGRRASLAAIARSIRERDARDRGRAVSPLVAAKDAVVLDTTGLTQAQTLARLLKWAKQKAR